MTVSHVENNSQLPAQKRPSLKINALSNWVALGVNIIIGFFLTPAIFAHLGEKRFGMWMLVSSVVGYFGLLRLGVGTGVFRYVPLFRGKNHEDKVHAVVSTAMAFYIVIGVAIFVTLFLCAGLIADFFQGGPELSLLIRLVGLAAALECPSRILDTAIRSYEGFVFANLVSILGAALRAGALFGCIFMGYGLIAMGWAIVIVAFLGLLAVGMTFRSVCKEVHLSIKRISFSQLKMLVCFGIVIVIATGANLLTHECPKQITGKVVSLEALGLFGIAALLVSYYRQLIYALTKVLMPRFSYLSGQKADNEARQLFLRGSRYVTIVAGAVALLLWSVGPSFLRLWVKDDNINLAIPTLIILAAGTLVLLSHYTSIYLLYGFGQQKKIAALAIIEGISVFAISLVLSRKYGMTGVAVGVAVPLVLVRGIIQTIYVCRLVKVSFWTYYADRIFRPWMIAIILAIASYWLGVANLANTWLVLFLTSGLIILAYGTAVYLMVIENEEQHRMKTRVLAVLKYSFS